MERQRESNIAMKGKETPVRFSWHTSILFSILITYFDPSTLSTYFSEF